MGFTFSRRKRIGRRTTANFSKSGVSVSRKMGRLTMNSRGRGSIRLFKGLGFRFKL